MRMHIRKTWLVALVFDLMAPSSFADVDDRTASVQNEAVNFVGFC
jgi:hypothetical protein